MIELQAVARGTRRPAGRAHLAAAPRPGEPARTLCGQELAPGGWMAVPSADCTRCLRRSADPSAVSSFLFNEDAGERLLELSLAAARERPRRQPASPAAPRERPAAATAPPPPPRRPAGAGLPLLAARAGLERAGAGRFRSPAGVIVRTDPEETRVIDVTYEGNVSVRRGASGEVVIAAGDLSVRVRGGELFVEAP